MKQIINRIPYKTRQSPWMAVAASVAMVSLSYLGGFLCDRYLEKNRMLIRK